MARPTTAFRWTSPHGEGLAAITLVVLAMVTFLYLCSRVDRPIVDDALISVGYARSLADGDGLRPTRYSQIAEGYSNPTWTVFLALFEKVGINSMRPAKAGGMLLVALSFPVLLLVGPLSQRRRIQLEDAVPPLLACTNATLAYWSLGGLETGLVVFLCALFTLLLYGQRTKRGAALAGLAGAALVMTRPEGALYAGALAMPWLLDWALATRLRMRGRDWVVLASFVVPLGLFLAFRRMYFGSFLPNTYYAKQSWFLNVAHPKTETLIYLRTFSRSVRALTIAGALGVGLSMSGGRKTANTAWACGLLATSIFGFAWYANGDWMREFRFLAPCVPFLAYPVGAGISGVRSALAGRRQFLKSAFQGVVAGATMAAIVFATYGHHGRWAEVKAQLPDVPRVPEERGTYGNGMRALLAPLGMAHPLVASPDMGALAVDLREAELMDLAGLTDVAIARHYGNRLALRDYFMNEGLPSMLIVWGPSNFLWSMPEVLGQYRAVTKNRPDLMMLGWVTPAADPRCPEGKTAGQRDTAAQMLQKLEGDLEAGATIRALARWRCYFAYRPDAELPTEGQRQDLARRAQSAAQREADEPALRAYSFCAVIGVSSYAPSTACRMRAEELRARLFPR